MNKRILIYCISFLLFHIVSCENKNKNKYVPVNSKPIKIESIPIKIDDEEKVTNSKSIMDISEISSKMQKQEKLTEVDYAYICNFLFNNNDESISEEIGYRLFEHLQKKQLNNDSFASYLDSKEISFKEKVLDELIKIMCIDIGEENYTYDTFIKDFDLFKQSASSKKAFNECMNNQ